MPIFLYWKETQRRNISQLWKKKPQQRPRRERNNQRKRQTINAENMYLVRRIVQSVQITSGKLKRGLKTVRRNVIARQTRQKRSMFNLKEFIPKETMKEKNIATTRTKNRRNLQYFSMKEVEKPTSSKGKSPRNPLRRKDSIFEKTNKEVTKCIKHILLI